MGCLSQAGGGPSVVAQPQPTGLEHESHDLVQWAAKPCQRPKWKCRHLPHTGLQPQEGIGAAQLTGAAQLGTFALHEQQPLPQPPQPPQRPQR